MNLFKKYKQLKKLSTASLLEESPQLPLILWSACVITGIIVLLMIWASLATIQETSVTYGEIVPQGHVQVIQHLEGGIVKSVLVNNGEMVAKGQLIITMDETPSKSELAEARSHEIALVLDKERLQAYIEKQPADLEKWRESVMQSKYAIVGHNDEINQLLIKEKTLLDSQNENLKNQKNVLEAQLLQQESQLKKSIDQLSIWKKNLSVLNEEFNMYQKLREEDYLSHKDYLDILIEINNAQGEESRLTTEITRLEKTILEYQYKLKELEGASDTAALKELGTIDNELLEIRHKIEKLENNLSHSNMYSPISGTVNGLQVFSGNVVKPGGVLVEIVPLNEAMVAETRIQPRDIGYVKVGDPVVVKLLTYDYARYGSIKGKLIEISASTFLDQENKPYYKAVIKLEKQYLLSGKKKKTLKPGMSVIADIITGRKTLMQYLLRPIQSSTSSAFRER